MKKAAKIAAGVVGAALLLGLAGLAVLRTGWFREQLRQRVVMELERASGGRVEVGGLEFDPIQWRGRTQQITVHGKEGPGQRPLFQAEAAEIELRLQSFVRRNVDLVRLRLAAPQINIQVQADGSTNIPQVQPESGRLFTETLLNLAVEHFEVERGAVWWNDRRYPLEANVTQFRARFGLEQGRYAGRVESERVTIAAPPGLPALESAAARVEMFPDRVEFPEVRAKTALSEVVASAAVSDLREPRWIFLYKGKLDAREVAAAVPLKELKGGEIHLEGSASYAGAQWQAEGKVSAERLAAAESSFRVQNAFISGQYKVEAGRWTVEGLRARLLGGEWNGRLEADWRTKRLALDGRLSGMRLEAVAEALSTRERRWGQLGWTALVDGALNVRSSVPPAAASVSVEGDVTLKAPPAGGQGIGVEGACRASYRGHGSELELKELRLSTGASSVSASGRIDGKRHAALEFRVETRALEELTDAARVLAAVETELPVRLDGAAVVRGAVTGSGERPEVTATVEASGFAYEGRAWDSFAGRLRWSASRLQLTAGRLAKGGAVINLNLTAQLNDGRLADESAVEAEVSVRDTEFGDLAVLAGRKDDPVTGVVSGLLRVSGSRKDPRGAGWVEMRRVALWGEPFDSLRSAVAVESGQLRLNSFRLTKAKGTLSGSVAFHQERKDFQFDLRTENVELASQQWLSAATGSQVTGTATAELAGSGRLGAADSSLEKLALEGTLGVRGITVDGRALGDLSANARTTGDRLHLEIESNFLQSRVSGRGEVLLRDRFPARGRVEFANLGVPAALKAAGRGDLPVQGSADGWLTVEGDATQRETLSVAGSLTRIELAWSQGALTRTLRGSGPVNWRLANRKVELQPFRLEGEGSDVRGSGSVDLGATEAVNLALEGKLNIGVLAAFWQKKAEIAGSSTFKVRVNGTHRQPNVDGRLEIQDASVGSEELPISLAWANAVVTFSRQRATIQKLTAEVGGGTVTVGGDADFSRFPVHYRLRARLDQVRLRYPRGFTSVLEGGLTFSGTSQRSLLNGEVRLLRAGTRSSVELATILAALKEPPRTPSGNDWLQNFELNVSIVSAPEIRFETSLARNLQADAVLRLRRNALNPSLLGRVNINGGEFEFQGTRYTINRGDITFANPIRIDPILNLDLETRVSGYDITLTLAGPLQKLNVSYRSDPPLPFNELITLLAVGRAPVTDPTLAAQQTAQARSLSQIGASTVIGQAIAKPVTGRLQRFFGVSRLKVDPEIGGPEGNPNARLTIDQQVGKDITFTYVYSLASAQEQIVRVQWAIDRQWSLIAVRDENGLFGVDFLYKKRLR